MNRIIKKAIVIFILINSIVFFLTAQSFTPLPTRQIIDSVFSINDGIVNMYIFQSGDNYIVIDAGKSKNNINKEIKKLGIDKNKVIALFLTHSDNDHVASIDLFKNAKVYIGKYEEDILKGKVKRVYAKQITKEYELLDNNQIIEINGVKIQCIFTPGHTIGSVSYLINDIYLFTGDTLSIKNDTVGVFNESYNMDTNTQKNSIRKLAQLNGVKYIFTGHHGYSDDFKKLFKNCLD